MSLLESLMQSKSLKKSLKCLKGDSIKLKFHSSGLSDFVSVIIREQKGLRKRDYLEKCCGSTK